MDGVTAIAVIAIASFGIDRIVRGVLFCLRFLPPIAKFLPETSTIEDPNLRVRAERRFQMSYYVLAGILGGVVLAYYGGVRIFDALNFETNVILDCVMTGLILIAGADRMSVFLKMAGGPGAEDSEPRPIEITGRLILEGESTKKVEG